MRVLGFGTAGHVARALARHAPERRIELVALSRAQADLADPEACAAAVTAGSAEAVINAASFTAIDRAESEPEQAHRINAEAPAAMAAAAAARGRPFLHVSYPVPAARPKNSVLDCTRIAATYGIAQPDWRPRLGEIIGELA